MKRKILISSMETECDEFFLDCNCSLERVDFTPLEERVKAEDPALSGGLAELKTKMAESDFQKYINSLTSLKIHGDTIFLITQNASHKSVIELKFIKQITGCFGVSGFRVIVLPY